jgi:hypothetical protein
MGEEKVNDPLSFDPDFSCVMEPAEEIVLKSQTLVLDVETQEVIGEQFSVPCPGVRTIGAFSCVMMTLDDFDEGRFRHEMWKQRIGKK